jgi:hypothetical protein
MRISTGSDRRTRNHGFVHRLRANTKTTIERSRPEESASTIAAPEQRHVVYLDLLERLSLSAKHAAQLVGRGLSEETITKNLYATGPDAGALTAVAGEVAHDRLCAGVPGFWHNRSVWKLAARPGDLLIPVRDTERRIVGIQLRSEDFAPRYRWLSSADRSRGSSAAAAIHYVLRRRAVETRTIVVTEGILKADVIRELLDEDVDGVAGLPGVAFASGAAEGIVRSLPNLRHAFIAFDADYRTNHAVARALRTVVSDLIRVQVTTDVMTWNPSDGKGLDDVLQGVRR